MARSYFSMRLVGVQAKMRRFSFMGARDSTNHSKLSRTLIGVLVLLWLSVFLNNIDRSNLSIAAPQLKSELGLSATQLGVLLSAFFWTYACLQIPAGWLVDRFRSEE